MDNRHGRCLHGWQQALSLAAVPGKGSAKDTATADLDGTARTSNTAPDTDANAGSGHPDTPAKASGHSKDSLKARGTRSRRTPHARPDHPLLDRRERETNLLKHRATGEEREALPMMYF